MKTTGQNVFNGIQWLFRQILVGIWNLLVNLFWLAIQLIELFIWGVSEIAPRMKRSHQQLKQAIAARNFEFLLLPFQGLLGLIWQFIVSGFWLTIQLIELIVWYLSQLKTATLGVPQFGDRLKRRSGLPQFPKPITSPLQLRQKLELSSKQLYVLVVALSLLLATFPIFGFVPMSHPFEGVAIVESLGFQSGEIPQSQILLQGIPGVQQLSLEGQQTFTLAGKFESEAEPRLNRLKSITVKLLNDESQWQVRPVEDAETDRIRLEELRLRQKARVENLQYDRESDRLSLVVHPAIRPNLLQLDLGSSPLQITLAGYQIPQLRETENLGGRDRLEFTFIPAKSQLKLNFGDRAAISAIVPESNQSTQWFAENLEVTDVRFYQVESTGTSESEIQYDSTVLDGKIRMARRSLNLDRDEFLWGETAPNLPIERLTSLQIIPKSAKSELPAGIAVGISGWAKQIQIGEEFGFPETSIQATGLNRWLPQEFIMGLIPIWAAAVSYCVYWLIDNYSKIW